MMGVLKRLLLDDSAQDLAEYGIALAVIGTVAAAAALVIATDVGSLWTQAQNIIGNAATGS